MTIGCTHCVDEAAVQLLMRLEDSVDGKTDVRIPEDVIVNPSGKEWLSEFTTYNGWYNTKANECVKNNFKL